METDKELIRNFAEDATKIVNNGIKLKREFRGVLIAVVGVFLGAVVVSTKDCNCFCVNIIGAVSKILCAISLVCLVISAYAPIYANNIRKEQICSDFVDSLLGQVAKKKQKGVKLFKVLEKIGLYLFVTSVLLYCVYSITICFY